MSFDLETWQNCLHAHYQKVAETMQELPIYQAQLTVAVTPMTPIQAGRYLGGLITPWFMNWVFKLVDEAGEDRHAQQFSAKVGQVVTLRFPSGEYEFIVNHQPHLGFYYTCALISDMHSLASQTVAQAVMEKSLQYLFDAEVKAETARQGEIRRYATAGTVSQDASGVSLSSEPTIVTEEAIPKDKRSVANEEPLSSCPENQPIEPTATVENVALSRRRLFGLRAGNPDSAPDNRSGKTP